MWDNQEYLLVISGCPPYSSGLCGNPGITISYYGLFHILTLFFFRGDITIPHSRMTKVLGNIGELFVTLHENWNLLSCTESVNTREMWVNIHQSPSLVSFTFLCPLMKM